MGDCEVVTTKILAFTLSSYVRYPPQIREDGGNYPSICSSAVNTGSKCDV